MTEKEKWKPFHRDFWLPFITFSKVKKQISGGGHFREEFPIECAPMEEEDPIIKKAVEMTMSIPVQNDLDVDSPYFIQQAFNITSNGDILFKGRPTCKK